MAILLLIFVIWVFLIGYIMLFDCLV